VNEVVTPYQCAAYVSESQGLIFDEKEIGQIVLEFLPFFVVDQQIAVITDVIKADDVDGVQEPHFPYHGVGNTFVVELAVKYEPPVLKVPFGETHPTELMPKNEDLVVFVKIETSDEVLIGLNLFIEFFLNKVVYHQFFVLSHENDDFQLVNYS
jgi:hypothetical protein